ncbi:Mitochondrial inner membrane organizing system component [Hypoxylon texense]
MLPTTLMTRRTNNYADNGHESTTQPTMCSPTGGPGCPVKYNQYSRIPPPASDGEIYGLAVGTCFLYVLMGWLAVIGIRTVIGMIRQKAKQRRSTDPENGTAFEPPQAQENGRSFLPSMGAVTTGELIQSARRKSINIAAGIRRDMGSIRRASHPPLDEEAAVGGHTEGVGTEGEADDSFLHQRHRTMAVPPA